MGMYEDLETEVRELIDKNRRLEGALESDLDDLRYERGELVNTLGAIQKLRTAHQAFNASASDILGDR